jgi:CRAL/TRIO domain
MHVFHCPHWTVKGHVYSMEREFTCSKARDRTVNAVVDFNGFSFLRNTPPVAVGKEIMLTLLNHYVGHIHQIFIVDAPAAFLYIWKLSLSPGRTLGLKSRLQTRLHRRSKLLVVYIPKKRRLIGCFPVV